MQKLKYGSDEYEAVIARANKLEYVDLLELTKLLGVTFHTDEPLKEDLLGVLDEGDAVIIYKYLEDHGV